MQCHTQKLIAVAVDKDRSSQCALKWAVENLVSKGQIILLIHVKVNTSRSSSSPSSMSSFSIPRLNLYTDGINENGSLNGDLDPETREIFLPFRVYCSCKDIQCQDIMLEDSDVVKAILEFVNRVGVEVLVLGAAAKGSIFRFKTRDIPASVLKGVPDFCSVFIVSKGKISSTRSSSRPAPVIHPLRQQILYQSINRYSSESSMPPSTNFRGGRSESDPSLQTMGNDSTSMKSPFSHRKGPNGRSYEFSSPDTETDISFVSSGRPSVEMHSSVFESFQSRPNPPRNSGFSSIDNQSYDSYRGRRSLDITSPELSFASNRSELFHASQTMEDVDAEMKRLKQELKQTMEMYSSACKEAMSANQKAMELHRWKMEEQQRLEAAQQAEEAAVSLVEMEKTKSKAAIEHAEAAQRIAQLEAQKRLKAEMRALKEAEEKNKVLNRLTHSPIAYRKYTIDEIEVATNYFDKSFKIGEGGYGPVYKCYLDHTPAAVKVLRPDAAQGRSQFQREVEVLSCIRHPNMVLLLGACPEYGCLVYEYMSNGSLEDRLLRRKNTPPLSWQQRFRIAAEIGTSLLFLHQTKPEPIVHRDLKPGNILLDRNFVSKISDVGLARLVPPSVADSVTQYHMTSAAGTFCYIDPEYQQTGMLGIVSDIYSLGIMYLQILTAKPPMGLAHHVERAIEKGTFAEMLDSSVPDWPYEEALSFGKLSLKCAELRRKDRPNLGKVVMPELEKLRALAEEKTFPSFVYDANAALPQSQVSMPHDEYPNSGQSDI